jgi:hypothetical protein
MHEYSIWYFDMGWLIVTAIGAALAPTIGLVRTYCIIFPAVLFAILGK